jgi:hypothetical protein
VIPGPYSSGGTSPARNTGISRVISTTARWSGALRTVTHKVLRERMQAASITVFLAREKAAGFRERWAVMSRLTAEGGLALAAAALWASMLYLLDPIVLGTPLVFALSELHPEGYVELLAAVAGVGGVFIALYFTAVATVAATIYAREPSGIGRIFAREQTGDAYLRYLAFVTSLAVLLLGERAFGLHAPVLAPLVLALFASIAVVVFILLGKQAFYLFDPGSLLAPTIADLARAVRQATPRGFRFQDSSFQAYTHRQAESSLEDIETLGDLIERSPMLRSRSLLKATGAVVRFLEWYSAQRQQIPTSSYWYQRAPKHSDVLDVMDSSLQVLLATGSLPPPKALEDREWIEVALHNFIFHALRSMAGDARWADMGQLLGDVARLCRSYARRGDVKLAVRLAREVAEPVRERFKEDPLRAASVLEQIGVVDAALTPAIATCLGFLDWLDAIDRPPLEDRLAGTKWGRIASLYQRGFPTYLLGRLEWLRTRLVNEVRAEGSRVSPLWYLVQMAAQVEAENIASGAAAVRELLTDQFGSWAGRMTEAGNPWAVACVRSRQLEAAKKTLSRGELLGRAWSQNLSRRKHQALWWPVLEPGEWLAQVAAVAETTVIAGGSMVPALLALDRPPGLPDYAGQFYQEAAEAILQSLIGNRVEAPEGLFPAFFTASIASFQRYRPSDPHQDDETLRAFRRAAGFVENLLELSGLSYVLSELHGNCALWEPVKTTWDRAIGASAGIGLVQVVAAIESITSHPFYPSAGMILRTSWQLRVFATLSEVPKEYVSRGSVPAPVACVKHRSALIRWMARHDLPVGIDGKSVFVQFYLRKRPEAAEFEWPRPMFDLERELRRGEDENDYEPGDGE